MASSCPVIDDFAKDHLHGKLRSIRQALVWKLDGLSEYDVRRPLTATGTNLLGLSKHMAALEAGISVRSSAARSRSRWGDGRTGVMPEYEQPIDTAVREGYRAQIERTARKAAGGSDRADLSGTHRAVATS
jgi:hypothetical protein